MTGPARTMVPSRLPTVWRAAPAAGGDARYWACHCADLTLQHTFRLFPDATGESMGPSGGHHTRFRTREEDLLGRTPGY